MTTPNSQRRKRQTALLSLIITLAVVTALLSGLYYWRMQNQSQPSGWQQQALPVTVIKVTPQSLPKQFAAVGELTAQQQVELTAETAGRVTAIHFESGQTVEAGAPLVQLFDAIEQAQLRDSEASLVLAKQQLQRVQELTPTGAESEEVLGQREAAYQRAQAQVESVQAQLRMKRIEAPFSGKVGLRQVHLGDYLTSGTPIATLTNLTQLYVEFALPQAALGQITETATITFTTDAYPGEHFTASLAAVEPQINPATRTVRVQAQVDNSDGRLRPGLYINAIMQRPEADRVLALPLSAVQASAQGNSVVVVKGEQPLQQGAIAVQPVQTGQRIGNAIIITAGLQAGDVVVVDGQNRLQPNAPVTVVEQQQPEELQHALH
ncbi:efflux RND transporter periplasmic adaptor subunit [Pseudidiomarina sediminum]|uniref:Efflux RND transporter periplasmic adaptor subunit n=1 Tax=Pseudidiomarina sediminum TaxID=431675 RepID=A0A432Z3R8_9GAMM|nr:efflux RND transporter periplasmic adaptor subunit [Pseudidiomarina sediminum]RUO72526.1 efflux RND transporter periplasmic adaptor subunit [Pseudidiomarina sediminum]